MFSQVAQIQQDHRTVLQYSSTPVLQYSSAPVLQYSSTPVLQCSSTPVLRYSSTPVLQYSSAPVLRYSGTPVLQYSSTPVLPSFQFQYLNYSQLQTQPTIAEIFVQYLAPYKLAVPWLQYTRTAFCRCQIDFMYLT